MTILMILLALLVSHFAGVAMQGPKHKAIHVYFSRIRQFLRFPGGLLVAIAVPALVAGWLEWQLWQENLPLLAFLFSTFVLVWSWGSRDLDADVRNYLQADSPGERMSAELQLAYAYRDPAAQDGVGGVIRGVFYQALVRWFGTIFWFLAGGAGAALAYRISQALLCEAENRQLLSAAEESFLNRWVALINLPPAVLATLGLAVVGDFDRGLAAARRYFENGRRSSSTTRTIMCWDRDLFPEVGCMNAVDGHDLDDAFEHDYEGKLGYVNSAMSLVWRLLVCWMTVIAIIQLTILLS